MRSWGFVSVWVSSETGMIRFLDAMCLNYYYGSSVVTPLIEFSQPQFTGVCNCRRGSLIVNEGIVGFGNIFMFLLVGEAFEVKFFLNLKTHQPSISLVCII